MTVSNITPASGSRCQGTGTTQFSAQVTNGESYSWSVEAGNSTINGGLVTWDPNFSGTATIRLSAYGCTGPQRQTIERTATFTVTPSVPVTIDIGGNRSVCPGSSITFHAQVNRTENVASYEWLRDGSAQISHNPSDPQNLTINNWDYPDGTTITCRIQTTGCTQSSYVTSTPVIVNRQTKVPFSATLNITPDRSPGFEYCYGEQVTFTAAASHPASFSWHRSTGGSGSGNTVTVNDFRGGNDYFTFTAYANPSGACLSNTTAIVSTEHYPIKVFNLTPLDGIVGDQLERCMGAGTTQFTSGFTNYKNYNWSIENAGSSQMNTGGLVTWDPDFYGVAEIKISAQGCSGTAYTTVTQTKDYKVGVAKIEDIDINQEEPVCQNVPTEFHAEAVGDRFQWSATGGATISPNGASATITWPNHIGTASVSLIAFACNETSTVTKSINVEVNAGASMLGLFGPRNLCYPVSHTTFTAYASNASEIRWSIAPSMAGTISQDGVVTWNPDFKDDTAIISTEALGCNGYTAPMTLPVTIHTTRPAEVPVVTQPFYVPYNKVITLAASGASQGQAYYWYRADGSRLTGNKSDPIRANTTYYVTIAELATSCESTPAVPFTIGLIENNYNYIKETTVLTENQPDPESIDALTVREKNVTTVYFDGFGRSMQTVVTQGSPMENDLITPVVYDEFGREARKYLPFAAEQKNGYYLPLQFTEEGDYTHDFYDNPSGEIAADDRPFSEIEFEASPLNRPLREFGPGEAWKNNNKPVSHQYLVNVFDASNANHEKIIAWTLDPLDLPVRSGTLTGSIEEGGYYATGQLAVKVTVDEQRNSVREYTDKQGRVILKKVQAVPSPSLSNDSQWAETYYIYDNFGNLRFVLQPQLVFEKIAGSSTYTPNTTDLANFAFRYRYDERQRMIEKQVPGASPVYMVYDDRDRLVMTQDGNQRNKTPREWAFTKYDVLNRPVLTGIYKDAANREPDVMQQDVNTFYNGAALETFYEEAGTAVHGYTNRSFPQVSAENDYLTVTYYDTYDFKTTWSAEYNYLSDELTQTVNQITYTQPAASFNSVRGQVTGAKVKVLDGGNIWLNTVNYYDDRYRIIQILSGNYKGGIERTSNLYDFSGKVLASAKQYVSEQIQWVNPVAVLQQGTTFINATGTGWGTAGIASTTLLRENQSGGFTFTATETDRGRMIGLTHENIGTNYNTIQYALFLGANSNLYIFEQGSEKALIGPYSSGDELGIERLHSEVRYYQNEEIVYISKVPSTLSLVIDIAFKEAGGSISNVVPLQSCRNVGIKRTFEYDHAGRMLKAYHEISEPVKWTNLYNIAFSSDGKILQKTGPSGGLGGADSRQIIAAGENGWIESEVYNTVNDRLFGLSYLNNVNAGHAVTYAVYLRYTGEVQVIEAGISKGFFGNYTVGDVFRVERINNKIYYKKNGDVFYESATPAAGSLKGDSYFSNNGTILYNTVMGKSVLLSANTFNELGELVKKKLHGTQNGTSIIADPLVGQPGVSYADEIVANTYNNEAALIAKTRVRLTPGFTVPHGNVFISRIGLSEQDADEINAVSGTLTFAQEVDYRYNIRGWLTRINNSDLNNNPDGGPRDYFGMNLAYNEGIGGITISAPQYNGNISAMKWSTNLGLGFNDAGLGMFETTERGYTFLYDPMNRLTSASHAEKTVAWQNTDAYYEGISLYDLNGNIKLLSRNDKDGSLMDELDYTYSGNQLMSVADAGNMEEGFKDGFTSGNDYAYDHNGNMTFDKNKGINGLSGNVISYNYLNLPEKVQKSPTEYIHYIYDAAGRKLQQYTVEGTKTKRTEYVGDFVYEAAPDPENAVFTVLKNSDFSNGTNGLEWGGCTLVGNQDDVLGRNDALKVTLTTVANNQHYINPYITAIPDQKYRITAAFYIPAENTVLDGFVITNSGGPQVLLDARNMQKGSWVMFHSGPITYGAGNQFIIRACNGSSIVFPGNGEHAYIGYVNIEKEEIPVKEKLLFINHEEGRIVVHDTDDAYGPNRLTNEDCTTLTNVEGAGGTVTRTNEVINGETYVKVVAEQNTSTPGILHSYVNVVAGKRYVFKVKGYRENTAPAQLYVMSGTTNIVWPGPALPQGSAAENWMSVSFTVPAGITQIKAGVLFSGQTIGDTFYVNKWQLSEINEQDEYAYEYQYHLKDHLGNVRLTFTTKPKSETYTATLENNTTEEEQNHFDSYSRITNNLLDHTDAGSVYDQVLVLNGGYNGQIGLSKTFAVVPGDTIKANVYAKYLTATGGSGNLANFAAAMLSAFGLPTPIPGEATDAYNALHDFGAWIAAGNRDDDESAPKGFVNILVFNEDFELMDFAYQQIDAASTNVHELLSVQSIIRQPGYAYVFLSNEGAYEQQIGFDDYSATHAHGPVIQQDDYYPFGLTFNSYQRENAPPNKYLYNGIERQEELDLGWDLAEFRTYESSIGRFMQIDPVIKDHESPYAWNTNNPILYPDPTGGDSTQRAQAVATAKEYVEQKADGNQYLMGAKGGPGEKTDCSGLVSGCVKAGGEPDPNQGNQSSGVLNIEESTEEVDKSEAQPGNIVTFRKASGYPYHTGLVTNIERDEDGNITNFSYIHSSSGVGPNEAQFDVNNPGSLTIKGFYKWDTKPDKVKYTVADLKQKVALLRKEMNNMPSYPSIGTKIKERMITELKKAFNIK